MTRHAWKFDWFSAWLGGMAFALLNLIFAVGPEKAVSNFHAWFG